VAEAKDAAGLGGRPADELVVVALGVHDAVPRHHLPHGLHGERLGIHEHAVHVQDDRGEAHEGRGG
jgi:hypothetical protein